MSEHGPWWYNPPEKTRLERIKQRLTTKVIAIILISVLAGAITVVAIQDYIRIRHGGWIKLTGFGLYWDENCTKPIGDQDLIDWGDMFPGTTYVQTIWLRYEGNYSLKTINHTIDMPEENADIDFTLIYNKNISLAYGDVMPIQFVLYVHADATEQQLLDWNTTIYGYEW